MFFIPYFCTIPSLIFIFSIIQTLDYPDYLVESQRVRIIEVPLWFVHVLDLCN